MHSQGPKDRTKDSNDRARSVVHILFLDGCGFFHEDQFQGGGEQQYQGEELRARRSIEQWPWQGER